MNSDAESTKRNPSAPFLPYLFRQDGKDRAVGDNQQLQICDNLSGASHQLPWKGSLYTRRFTLG